MDDDANTWCPSIKARCECHLEKGHEGDHECDCGGAWDRDGEVVRFPQRIVW